jgi:hypothetical protein
LFNRSVLKVYIRSYLKLPRTKKGRTPFVIGSRSSGTRHGSPQKADATALNHCVIHSSQRATGTMPVKLKRPRWGLLSEAGNGFLNLVAGAGFEPATFGL